MIIEAIGDICVRASERIGKDINYIFGDTEYVNNILTILSKSPKTSGYKYPLLILYTGFLEDKSNKGYTKANISLTIADKTLSGYTNEKRLQLSFVEILRPIYDVFIDEIKKEQAIIHEYDGTVKHMYRERFDLGSAGAMDSNGKKLIDLIDAIDIENLEIKVKTKTKCYGKRI